MADQSVVEPNGSVTFASDGRIGILEGCNDAAPGFQPGDPRYEVPVPGSIATPLCSTVSVATPLEIVEVSAGLPAATVPLAAPIQSTATAASEEGGVGNPTPSAVAAPAPTTVHDDDDDEDVSDADEDDGDGHDAGDDDFDYEAAPAILVDGDVAPLGGLIVAKEGGTGNSSGPPDSAAASSGSSGFAPLTNAQIAEKVDNYIATLEALDDSEVFVALYVHTHAKLKELRGEFARLRKPVLAELGAARSQVLEFMEAAELDVVELRPDVLVRRSNVVSSGKALRVDTFVEVWKALADNPSSVLETVQGITRQQNEVLKQQAEEAAKPARKTTRKRKAPEPAPPPAVASREDGEDDGEDGEPVVEKKKRAVARPPLPPRPLTVKEMAAEVVYNAMRSVHRPLRPKLEVYPKYGKGRFSKKAMAVATMDSIPPAISNAAATFVKTKEQLATVGEDLKEDKRLQNALFRRCSEPLMTHVLAEAPGRRVIRDAAFAKNEEGVHKVVLEIRERQSAPKTFALAEISRVLDEAVLATVALPDEPFTAKHLDHLLAPEFGAAVVARLEALAASRVVTTTKVYMRPAPLTKKKRVDPLVTYEGLVGSDNEEEDDDDVASNVCHDGTEL